jgi:hypothetical protein
LCSKTIKFLLGRLPEEPIEYRVLHA